MEVISFLLVAAILGTIFYWVVMIGGVVLLLLWVVWPVAIGVTGGLVLWFNGADNLAVLLVLTSLVGQVVWLKYSDDGSRSTGSPSMSDKKRVYDKDGKITGYVDKD